MDRSWFSSSLASLPKALAEAWPEVPIEDFQQSLPKQEGQQIPLLEYEEPLVRYCRRRLHALKEERRSWDEHYKDLARHILPWSAQFLEDGELTNDGSKKADPVDSTAREALRVLAAGMQGGLTPKSIPWFRLSIKKQEWLDYPGMRLWLQKSTQLLHDILAKSNFYHVIAQNYEELALYGTSAMYVEDDFDTVVRFRALTVGEYYISNNWHGKVDTLFRVFDMSARNIVAEFGWDRVSDRVRNLYREAPDSYVRLVHAVLPRQAANFSSPWPCHMPFASYTFEHDVPDDGQLLRESGYKHFPYLVATWATVGNNVYGYSPGMDALPDVKQLKIMQEEKADIVRKISNPPMIAPPELKGHYLSTASGEVSFADARSGQAFIPVLKYDYNVSSLIPAITELQNSVKKAFFNELFRMFTGEGVQGITATEVLERRQERLSQIGPVLERLQSAIFAPLIDLLLHRCESVGILPKKPFDFDCVCMHVDYTSTICQSQRMAGLGAISQLANFAGEIAKINPEILDKFDTDKVLDEYATMLGVPLNILRSDVDVSTLRKERKVLGEGMTQKQEADTQFALLERLVGLAKELHSMDVTKNTAFTQLFLAVVQSLDSELLASLGNSEALNSLMAAIAQNQQSPLSIPSLQEQNQENLEETQALKEEA